MKIAHGKSEQALSLLGFIAETGPEGRQWVESYNPFGFIEAWKDEAMASLREGRLEEGRDILLQIGCCLETSQMPVSVLYVMRRWYHGALGYYHYCVEDFDEAEDELDRAFDAVRNALEVIPFLVPLAHHCSDFSLQKARIDRRRRRWLAMRKWIEEARSMLQDRAPYCVLSNGTAITVSTLKRFYRSLPLSSAEENALVYFLDDQIRVGQFEHKVLDLYSPLGWVIPYP